MNIKYFDIHSHLNFESFNEDRGEIIKKMERNGIYTICVGTDLKTSKETVALSDKYKNIYACIGLHPTDSIEDFKEVDYEALIKNKKVVAIGECGLDYFHGGKTKEDKERQKEVFRKQIEFALKYDKPLMIHCRDAYDDLLAILREYKEIHKEKLRGNIHFFVGTPLVAKEFLSLGFTLSFTGVITFSDDYNISVIETPIDKIMTETDCPFVAPKKYRGKRNSPLYIQEIISQIAKLKDLDENLVAEKTVENAINIFNLDF